MAVRSTDAVKERSVPGQGVVRGSGGGFSAKISAQLEIMKREVTSQCDEDVTYIASDTWARELIGQTTNERQVLRYVEYVVGMRCYAANLNGGTRTLNLKSYFNLRIGA